MTPLSSTFLEKTKEEVKNTISLFEERGLSTHTFCVMPFTNIILEPNGEVGVCRHKGTKFTFGNLNEKTIDEIWQSEKLQQWRSELLSEKPQICATELIDERCNLCPELNKLLPFAEIHNIKNPKILRLTANLNGKCNLECPMCDVWKMPNGYYTEKNFWIPARERFFKEIQEIDLLSGEPFIQKDTYRLIDEISILNPECLWTITTNLHWKLSSYIIDQLNKIKIKNLIISIDSLIHDSYKKIRKLGNLDFVLSNLEAIQNYEQKRKAQGLTPLNIRLNCTTQIENWKEVKNIIHFCLKKNIIPFITFLYKPSELSLLSLPYEERLKILDFYFSDLNREEILFALRIIKPLIRSLSKIDYSFYILELQRKTS